MPETNVMCPRHHRVLEWARCECCNGEAHIDHQGCECCNGEGGWFFCDVCVDEVETVPEANSEQSQ